ncbi:MAG: CapA family protein [Patescibacteria group bacterium]|nr:CapA family protein [Patescibacteria group bacterium]
MSNLRYKKILLLGILLILLITLLLINFVFTDNNIFKNNKIIISSQNVIDNFSDIIDRNVSDSEFDVINPTDESISLLFFGDLMLDRHVGEKIDKYGLDYLLEKLNKENFTSSYDVVLANLEGAVAKDGAHYLPHSLYDFSFSPNLISSLKKYNFNFFNLANNHLSDQGQKGIEETYQNLSDLGFYYFGCRDAFLSPSEELLELKMGDNQPVLSEENCSDIVVDIKNKKIAFLGFSMVYKNIDENRVIERIKSLKEKSDLLIVNVHFGIEYQELASQNQVNLARKMVDNGADIIIGHHPHVIQNYEIYQQKPIFYSLGNFIFDQYFSPETQEGLAVSLTVSKDKEIVSQVYKIKTKGSRIDEILKMP